MKYNPATLAIRAGFLAGLKTNFGRIASNLYWAYFTLAEAKKAGVTESFWNKSVLALKKTQTIFEKLGGAADAMKKAIVTGRAAKTSKKLASKGKLSGFHELLGIGTLGELGDPAIAAGIAALTAVAGMIQSLFKNKKGKQETETGGETDAAPLTDTDPGFTVQNDGAPQAYKSMVDQSGENNNSGNDNAAPEDNGEADTSTDSEGDRANVKAGQGKSAIKAGEGRGPIINSDGSGTTDENGDSGDTTPTSGKKGLIIGAVALAAAGGIYLATRPKAASKTIAGVDKKETKATKKTVKLS